MENLESQLSESFDHEEINYWLRVKREAYLGSLQPLEDAAKQIVVITSLLQGIYFAAISISDIKKVNSTANPWFDVFIVLSLLTLGFWMASLYFATRVFIPKVYSATSTCSRLADQVNEIRIAYNKTSTYKYQQLKKASWLLWLSFFPFAANVLIYLAVLPVPPPK
jgi:hypothetical protein